MLKLWNQINVGLNTNLFINSWYNFDKLLVHPGPWFPHVEDENDNSF